MPELRWTLLIIGVLFVAILAWWERRRPHQASRQAPHISEEPRTVVTDGWGGAEGVGTNSAREPSLTLPEIRTDARSPSPVHIEREPTSPRELPVVEIPDDAMVELRSDDDRVDFDPIAADRLDADSVDAGRMDADRMDAGRVDVRHMGEGPMAADRFDADNLDEEALDEVLEDEAVVVIDPPAAPVSNVPPPPTEFPKPLVEWPPEDQRTLVSLRLVARPPDRFRGNLLRQALAAEGFVLGDFDIFHKPDANNRAVLSAASLTKPGSFDLETMDTQRFTGLNLFAVLPGPKSPQKAFEELLIAARMLNERLEGALQDDRGGPLTPMRIQALRDSLGAEAKS